MIFGYLKYYINFCLLFSIVIWKVFVSVFVVVAKTYVNSKTENEYCGIRKVSAFTKFSAKDIILDAQIRR